MSALDSDPMPCFLFEYKRLLRQGPVESGVALGRVAKRAVNHTSVTAVGLLPMVANVPPLTFLVHMCTALKCVCVSTMVVMPTCNLHCHAGFHTSCLEFVELLESILRRYAIVAANAETFCEDLCFTSTVNP